MQPRMRQCQHQGQMVPHQLQMTCLENHVFILEQKCHVSYLPW